MEEWNDIYDENRQLTGKKHRRGTPCPAGAYDFVVCVWVYDGDGRFLLTRRAPEKSFPGTWENSGGAVLCGEDSRRAIVRELREETGLCAEAEEFVLLAQTSDSSTHYDHYGLCRKAALSDIRLLPQETDAVQWASYADIHRLIATGAICAPIANSFLRLEPLLKLRNLDKNLS